MVLTENEKKALDEKMTNPETNVKCPRCGNELEYKEYSCGCIVKCKTKGCIEASLRGI
jgi:transcription initiation factor IIE alpha subunit